MICHHYKCIFIHIPKTAGQSIEHVFLNLLGLTWETREPLLLRTNNNKKLGPPRLAHLKATEYLEYKYISEELFNSYYKFTFVRNPWSRLVSFYNYRKFYRIFSFKYFTMKILKDMLWKHNNWFTAQQSEFIQDNSGRIIVDYVGKFENLQTDFNTICDNINVENIELPHINKSKISNPVLSFIKIKERPNKHYSEYYDTETKEFVEQIYKNDIEKFNYHFEEKLHK